MSLVSQLTTTFTAIGGDVGVLADFLNGGAADLDALTTTDKTSLVNALNELKTAIDNATDVDDAVTNTTNTWSSSKISAEITSAVVSIVDGAPGALNTLNELAAALNDDANQINTILTALGNRVAVDQVQSFTDPQKVQACVNIGVGDPETDFLAIYNTAKG
jgi:hypothetical protein